MLPIGPLAVALDTDPKHLLRLALQEYMPDTLIAIEAHFCAVVTHNELEMLTVIRKASSDADPKLRAREQREQLAQWSRQITAPSHLVYP